MRIAYSGSKAEVSGHSHVLDNKLFEILRVGHVRQGMPANHVEPLLSIACLEAWLGSMDRLSDRLTDRSIASGWWKCLREKLVYRMGL